MKKHKIKEIYGQDCEFQILQWFVNDMDDDESGETFCYVYCFGCTKFGHSVSLGIKGFKPYFFIKVPENWILKDKKKFSFNLEQKLGNYYNNINNISLVKRKIFYGFRGDNEEKFIKISFDNMKTFYYTRKILKNPFYMDKKIVDLVLYEEKVDPILQFVHTHNIKTTSWVSFPLDKSEKDDNTRTKLSYILDIEYLKVIENNNIAPFMQLSYDIETYSSDPDIFPVPENIDNPVIQIGITLSRCGNSEIEKQIILTLKECEKIEDDKVETYCFDNEKKLLLKFKEIIREWDPDIIYSYNGYRFDDNYLVMRSRLLSIENTFLNCSRFEYINGKLNEKTFTSSAYGCSKWNYLVFPGRVNIDLYIYINREFNLDSYKLDNVAKHFLSFELNNTFVKCYENKVYFHKDKRKKFKKGQILTIDGIFDSQCLGKIKEIGDDWVETEEKCDNNYTEDTIIKINVQKDQMAYRDMFIYYKEGGKKKIKEIAEYCLQDSLIPIFLVDKLSIIVNLIQMSLVTYVPVSFLIERGQQIKVYSQILKETKNNNYVIPTIQPVYEQFEGATVLDPIPGFYQTVSVLDFASLYPSIIRAYNLCYSSIVLDKKWDNIKGYEYENIEWVDKNDKIYNYRIVKNAKTILPNLLKDLTEERKIVKNKMKIEKDEFKYMILNGFQLALKISSNSIYGFLSAQTLQCTPIAACVTAIGRNMIKDTKKFIDNNYTDFKTIYGDSVIGKSPVVLRDLYGNVYFKFIEDVCNNWIDYDVFKNGKPGEKKQALCDYEIWSGNGWTKIIRLIKHKTRKKIFRVSTDKGIVVVTEDHSLMDKFKNQIKPKDCVLKSDNSNLPTKLWYNDFN